MRMPRLPVASWQSSWWKRPLQNAQVRARPRGPAGKHRPAARKSVSQTSVVVVVVVVIVVVVVVMVVIVTVTVIVIPIVIVMVVDVFRVIPVVLYEIDRSPAGVVFGAMLLPVPLVPRTHMQIHRWGIGILGSGRNDDRLRVDDRRARVSTDVDLAVEAGLPD